jgi:hypothetical protein
MREPQKIDPEQYMQCETLYRTQQDAYYAKWLDHLQSEPPKSDHDRREMWKKEGDHIIRSLNDLEQWFVDVDEPMPSLSESATEEEVTQLAEWYDRMDFKVKHHYTKLCRHEIIALLKIPDSIRIKQARRHRLHFYQAQYEEVQRRLT